MNSIRSYLAVSVSHEIKFTVFTDEIILSHLKAPKFLLVSSQSKKQNCYNFHDFESEVMHAVTFEFAASTIANHHRGEQTD